MIFFKRIPGLVRWILSVMFGFLVTMTIFRFLFFFSYNQPGKPFSGSSFLMGLRFDLKFVCIMGLVMLVACSIPFLNPLRNSIGKKIWLVLLPLVFTATVLFYTIDYYYYDYLQQRLNASVLSYLHDAAISFNMALESYPVFKVLAAIVLIAILSAWYFKKLIERYQPAYSVSKKRFSIWYIISFVVFALGVFGKVGQFNLRWSDAYLLNDNFKASLALNPFQSFFSTLNFKDTRPDINKVKDGYSLMAKYLQVQQPDSNRLNYERNYSFNSGTGNKPNVVLVICESFQYV